MGALLHGGIDRLAMWIEDRTPHAPQPWTACAPRPLACFGPLGPMPEPPSGSGPWSAPSPLPLRRHDRMSLHAFPSAAPFRGTVVLVPPWKIERPSLLRGYVRLLARAGLDVWLLVPPEHMERAAPGAPSGHGFASLDLHRFRALFEQLVIEIRTAMVMASRRGPAGVVGLSLGALACTLAISAGAPPGFAALVAPPADLAAVLLETAIGRRYGRLAARAGSRWPEAAELRAALAPFDPCARPIPATRVLLAAGRDDAIALSTGAMALARAWRIAPRIYPRGHLTLLFFCAALRRDLERFVSATERPDRPAGSAARPWR
jgi:hypothetical protein